MSRLIDADELLLDYQNICNGVACDDCPLLDIDRECKLEKMINDAPTVDVVPVVHGHWIKDRLCTTSGGTYGVNRCSVCEASYQDIGYGFNYCPNCGALMDEVTNDV